MMDQLVQGTLGQVKKFETTLMVVQLFHRETLSRAPVDMNVYFKDKRYL